ncbi:flagellar motor control protein ZomB [Gordonia sp. ABSL1-1]|uniref:flagellar motor control protein ZomB n=1 Tax=Gordonia sp. ABSL1-1 TaxID=3053923 RepID=UPI002572D5B2|nr:flagellar motor control protein ZomB [Gordonia sp. ABSL1-1]MDL9937644.1 flagellar motor control protein ZomB [Gordonia sp. ABSL1-1]
MPSPDGSRPDDPEDFSISELTPSPRPPSSRRQSVGTGVADEPVADEQATDTVSDDDMVAEDRTGEDGADDRRVDAPRTGVRSWGSRQWVPVGSFVIGAVTVATFFAIGAWQRRWIADDGLIVLRTLRNLFAGNGPVFNAGERVEANTSTAWTYVLWFWAWITDGQLEYVALWVALVLSVAATPIAMYGTARLYGSRLGGLTGNGWTLLLPLGAVVYIAVPPARDFATSGLENGLCIFWVAVLWAQLVAWARRGPHQTRSAAVWTLLLAFTAGLAPLIRPELAVVGGLALLLVFCAPIGARMRIGMIVVAAILPVGYQIFRMGYYALLVPNPAVAKDASGSKWAQGGRYLTNLFGPYVLLLPVILAVVAGVVLIVGNRLRKRALGVEPAASSPASARERLARFSRSLQTPTAVTVTVLVAGFICGTYWVRQGGDFMHGRVLLTPLFILLLPMMVVPITIPAHIAEAFRRGPREVVDADAVPAASDAETASDADTSDADAETVAFEAPAQSEATVTAGAVGPTGADVESHRGLIRAQLVGSALLAGVWVATLVWAISSHSTVLPNAGIDIGRSGIVDERRFYVTNMGNENPVTAEDYLDYPRMRAMVEMIDKYHEEGGVILPSSSYDEWYVARMPGIMPKGVERQVTVYFLNLGMTSMNAPLDVRVIDQMGLAYPLAAHTERLEDGRIGHDKILPSEWVVAEAGAYPRSPVLPGYLDEDTVAQARLALTCPETKARYASFTGPWTFARFKHNLRESFTYTDYRIQRNPEYELQRCGIPIPPPLPPIK